MGDVIHYNAFLLAGILLNITPGNDTVYILSRSLSHGGKAGTMSVLGIATGNIIHTLFAAFGLSLIIAKSPLVFETIKYLGAIYLFYLGFKMLTNKLSFMNLNESDRKINYKKIYRDGIITNVLNPKVALFFLAFLPQFIQPNVEKATLSFFLLGLTFTTTGTLWGLILNKFSSLFFSKFINDKWAKYVNIICGIVLILLGLNTALINNK